MCGGRRRRREGEGEGWAGGWKGLDGARWEGGVSPAPAVTAKTGGVVCDCRPMCLVLVAAAAEGREGGVACTARLTA